MTKLIENIEEQQHHQKLKLVDRRVKSDFLDVELKFSPEFPKETQTEDRRRKTKPSHRLKKPEGHLAVPKTFFGKEDVGNTLGSLERGSDTTVSDFNIARTQI